MSFIFVNGLGCSAEMTDANILQFDNANNNNSNDNSVQDLDSEINKITLLKDPEEKENNTILENVSNNIASSIATTSSTSPTPLFKKHEFSTPTSLSVTKLINNSNNSPRDKYLKAENKQLFEFAKEIISMHLASLLNRTFNNENATTTTTADFDRENIATLLNNSVALENNTNTDNKPWLLKFSEDTINIVNQTNGILIYFTQIIFSIIVMMCLILGLFKCYRPRQWLLHTFLKDFRRMINADQFKT